MGEIWFTQALQKIATPDADLTCSGGGGRRLLFSFLYSELPHQTQKTAALE